MKEMQIKTNRERKTKILNRERKIGRKTRKQRQRYRKRETEKAKL